MFLLIFHCIRQPERRLFYSKDYRRKSLQIIENDSFHILQTYFFRLLWRTYYPLRTAKVGNCRRVIQRTWQSFTQPIFTTLLCNNEQLQAMLRGLINRTLIFWHETANKEKTKSNHQAYLINSVDFAYNSYCFVRLSFFNDLSNKTNLFVSTVSSYNN